MRSTLHPAWAVLAKVHAGVACVRGVIQTLVDRLTKSGLRQFVAGALMRAWESREAETRGGSDRGKYNFKSITADETEFMFLMLCPCLDGLVDAGVAALNAHRGSITPRPAPVEDPMPDCIHACGLLLSWYSNSMTPNMTRQQIFACKKEGGQAMLALQQTFPVRNMSVAKCTAVINSPSPTSTVRCG